MSSWEIRNRDGSVVKTIVRSLEFNDEFMGESYVSVDISSPHPIDFECGDYLIYRGSRYEIDYDPSVLKQSARNTYGEAFKYSNVKFNSLSHELAKCGFLDYVIGDNNKTYFSSPTFSFFAGTVQDLADRIKANLDRLYTGSRAWTVVCNPSLATETEIEVSADNISVWDALALAYSQFGANFTIKNRTITIGTDGTQIGSSFSYGKGNGLVSIEMSSDNKESLVTRLRAYGSTRNLPPNYYRNKGLTVHYPIEPASSSGPNVMFPTKLEDSLNQRWEERDGTNSKAYKLGLSLDGKLVVYGLKYKIVDNFQTMVSIDGYANTESDLAKWTTQLHSGNYDKIIVVSGVDKSRWAYGDDYRTYADYFPASMSITRLMLPGFPVNASGVVNTDPHIDSANIPTYGIREGVAVFDGSSDELYEIYPSIEGMTSAQLIAAGYDVPDQGKLDVIPFDATEIGGAEITDEGTFGGETESNVSGFQIRIKDIGFDIKDYVASSGEPALAMRDGMCAGRQFTIKEVKKVGGFYVLNCTRTEDVIYYPNRTFNIKAGDRFVIINIEMPDVYIDAASQRLLEAATDFLADYDKPHFTYTPKIDNIMLAREHEQNGTSSVYYNIYAGEKFHFSDTDLSIEKNLFIDRLTIKEGNASIPELEVVIRDEKLDTTLGKLQSKVNNVSGTASSAEKTAEKALREAQSSDIDLIERPQVGTRASTDDNTYSALAEEFLLSSKLDIKTFEDAFELIYDNNGKLTDIRAKAGLFSDDYLSAFGKSSEEGGGTDVVAVLANLLDIAKQQGNDERVKGIVGDSSDDGKTLTYNSETSMWEARVAGGDKNYVHTQGLASKTWTIVHNLGKRPNVSVVNYQEEQIDGDVKYIDNNSLTINFDVLVDGKAYLN